MAESSSAKLSFQTTDYEQLDRLTARFEKIFYVLIPVLAVLVSLAVVSVFIVIQGASPLVAYASLFKSAFGSAYNISTSLNRAVPLILAGLGVALAARAGMINIGGEGQIILGGVFATMAAIQFQSLPAMLLVPLCILAGALGGALWALVPGYFFARFGTNLIITTILLNDIAIGVLGALVKGPMKEAGGYAPQSAMLEANARLPFLVSDTRLHMGVVLAVVLVCAGQFLVNRTSFGHEMRTIGENPQFARHSGIKVQKMQIWLMLLAGGLAGIAGSVEIMGAQHRLREGFLHNYGYEALAVALLGQKSPVGVLLAGLLFGALKAGRGGMVRAAELPVSFSMVLSGVIIFFVVISPVMLRLPKAIATRRMRFKHSDRK